MIGTAPTANGHSPLEYAVSYLDSGLSVCPILADGTKAAAVKWQPYQERKATRHELNEWFRHGSPRGVAIVYGPASGNAENIDIDEAELFSHFREECDRVAPGLLDRLTLIRTPRPGYHIVYRCDVVEGNQKLAMGIREGKPKAIIETRGSGGYALAPGCPLSCNPNTDGRLYEHASGPPLTSLVTITVEERATLFRVSRSFNELVDDDLAQPSTNPKSSGQSPGDAYNARTAWDEVLGPHGWVKNHARGNVTYWRRPGKDVGWSATTGHESKQGNELFCCFSDNAHPFQGASGIKPCSTYTKFAAYALLNHNGDFAAAARVLGREGFGDRKPGRTSSESATRTSDDGKPSIDTSQKDLSIITPLALAALQAANEPVKFFRFGGRPSRLEVGDESEPIITSLDFNRMRHELARAAEWTEQRKSGDEMAERATAPPKDVVADVLATSNLPLPILTRIVESPVFAANGTIQTEPGYHQHSRTYYVPAVDFSVSPVPAHPEGTDLESARILICDELLGDFPFVGEAEKAHAVALALLPFARDLISGATPLHLFEKPTPGTGATLLVDMLTFPAIGRAIAAMSEARDEDEWRKRITAKVRGGCSHTLIDNLRRRLDSAALSAAITSATWEDRVLGLSEVVRLPIRNCWLATGNNPGLSTEMSRRTVRIRMDARLDRPWLREGFRHPNIRQWAADHRAELVWSLLTMVQAWISAGRPKGKTTLGMFEQWSEVIGGILGVAGVPGFLSNLNEFYEESDAEGGQWRSFLLAWWAAFTDNPVTVKELWMIASGECCVPLGDKGEQSQKITLGKMLSDRRDRIFDLEIDGAVVRLLLERGEQRQRAYQWRLRPVSG